MLGHNALGCALSTLKTLTTQLTPEKTFFCWMSEIGNSIDLLMHFEGLNFDTVKLMAQVLGMDLEQVIEKDEEMRNFKH